MFHVREKACLCQRTCLSSLEMKCIYLLDLSSIQK